MRKRAEQFWADFFGLEPEELDRPGARVVAHRGLGDYAGAWIFWRDGTVLISTPPQLADEIRTVLRTTAVVPHEPERLVELFAGRTERMIGPAYQGYLDPDAFRPHQAAGAPPVPVETGLIQSLRVACDPEEWSHAGIEPERPEPCFGYCVENRLVALAQNAFWAEGTVSPGLIVHPGYRGQGYGKTVLTAAAADALTHGHLVLYQTLLANAPAIHTATALGFTQFATHLAVRFQA
jgi:GNAT superfamily N-acetyltransferase